MDSGISGSLQSSSGGDEEYDSRPDSISAFFHPPTATAIATATAPSFFDSLSYLTPSYPPPTVTPAPPPPPPEQPTPTSSTATLRTSKKRSRASRRAPTTVLTTDTSNFRAMVQEFTGIPSPPFPSSSSSSFPRSRLDFFHPSASTASRDPPPPPYLLRPFAQKLQNPTFALIPPTSITTTTTTTNSTPTNNNYQLLSSSSNLLNNIHNPILNFQSLLQSPLTTTPGPKYNNILPAMPPPAFGAKSQGQVSSIECYGVADLSFPGLIGSGWADGTGAEVGNYVGGSSKVSSSNSCKLNYSVAGSTEFHAEKGSEAARGEGMVESWICSSD